MLMPTTLQCRRIAPVAFLSMLSVIGMSPHGAGAAPPRWAVEDPAEVELQASEGAPAGFDQALRTEDGRIQVMIELLDPPAAVVFAEAMQGAAPFDKRAQQLAGAASKAQVARIEVAQDRVAAEISSPRVGARELFRVQKALNGIAVAVPPDGVRALANIPGVKRILPIYLEYPNNSTSVPFIGTPNVWANTIGLPEGADGTGIRIGIIDTGIDYMHADFGGTGLLADYQAESTDTANFSTLGTATAGSFPTVKVVGGNDFAGDAYTGNNAPAPDPNPMDCNGHGSHVAGTAAGFGVTAAGATFTGPYDANAATYSPLRIGPGTAPQALLYGLRVFGCAGGTGLTTLAIDWAMDPNGDSDLSDHLDVINMSLGSPFGSAVSSSSVAADNAALAGVIVVTSAGNSSDTFFISGSPGSATRALATAASVDNGELFPLVQVHAPAGIAGNYLAGSAAFGAALTASGTPPGPHNVVIALDPADGAGPLTTDGCSPITNAAAVNGNIALIDRGTCNFTVKAKNAQLAGAVGVIFVDNAPGTPPPGVGGADPTVTIPSVRVTLADGNLFKANIATLNVTLLAPNGADTMASFSSRGPRRIFGSPLRLKPDIAAPGLNITSVQTGHTCFVAAGCTGVADPSGFQAGSQPLTISGTSMASPHMAGIMALLRQLHPDWSVEELKALAMNYAIHDVSFFPGAAPPKFPPSRAGAGRVDPSKSALGDVIAMNADDAGLVSVTFEPQVTGVVTRTKKVRVVNKGTTSQTYDLAIDTTLDSPGVSFSLPGGSSVTVPAGETVELDVQMTADASQMDHTRDPSLFPTQGVQANYGDQPRNFLAEEGGYITFSQSSTLKLRVPLYMAEKPASAMSAADTIVTGGAGTGSTTIPLSGTGLCTGTLAAGPTCTGTFPLDVESLVSPFELQVVSPLDPVNSTDYADIHYVGVSFLPGVGSPNINNDLVLFGVASWGDWSTLNEVAYNICVDNNEDGVYDRIVINTNPAVFVANAPLNDNFVRIIQNAGTGGFTILGLGSFVNLVGPNVIDTALHLNNVMILGATPSQLGIASTADTTFRYKVVTCPATNLACARTTTGDRCSPPAGTFFDQAAGPYFYNWGAQGLNFGGNFLDEDLNGNTLGVTWNTANMATNGSLGALLLHHHNGAGQRAEVALLDTAQSADLAITKSVDNPVPAAGTNVVFTLTVTNNGPNNATGVVVNEPLAIGLNYVSDDGGGAYNPATGLWTVGALANGASAVLHVTASVDSTEGIENPAEITAGAPLDPNPANNRATANLRAPRSADLAITFGANVATVNPGQPIVYTLTVTNNGDDPAYSVDLQEDFPLFPALNPSSFTASQGVYNPATGHWDIASLPKGNTATLQFTVMAPNFAGSLVNNATASSAKSLFRPKAADPNTGDNAATATVMVLSPSVISTVSKTVAGSFLEGGAVTYTVTLANTGSFDQQNNTGDEFVDVLPSQLTLTGASSSSGITTTGGNTVHWNGSIPAGGSVTITINATINAGTALQTVSNQGTVNHDNDGNGTNEIASLTDNPAAAGASDPTSFFVTSPASVGTRTKTVTGTFAQGGTVTYTVTISNPSASLQGDNPGDEFTDVLPSSLTLTNATATSGAATTSGNTVHWNGTIAAGGSVTITITATINTSTIGLVVSNQGTIFFDADGNGTNESSALTDDPAVAGANDPTVFQGSAAGDIPTLSEVGLAMLALLLAGGAMLILKRRQA